MNDIEILNDWGIKTYENMDEKGYIINGNLIGKKYFETEPFLKNQF